MRLNAKKVWKTVKWTLLIVCGVVAVTIAILAVTGVPKLGQVMTRNVPRVGWSSLMSMIDVASPPPVLLLHGFDQDGNLEFGDPTGLVSKLDDRTGAITTTDKSMPLVMQRQRLAHSDDYLFLRDRSSDERYDLVQHHAATGVDELLLSAGYGDFHHRASPDGSVALAHVIDLETFTHPLYRIDLTGDRTPRALCSFDGHLAIQAFDSQRRFAYVLHTRDDKTARLLRIDLDDGSYETVFADERERTFHHGNDPTWLTPQTRFLLGKDDATAFYARTGEGDDEREFVCLWERDLRTGASQRLSPPQNADVCRFCLSHDERFVTYVMVEKGHPTLHVFDRQERRDHVAYDDREDVLAHQWMLEFLPHPDKDVVFFTTSSTARRGARLMSLDLQTRAVTTVVDQRDTTDRGAAFTTTEFEYPTSAPEIGVMTGIHAYKVVPKAASDRKRGVVIACHGGPDTAYTPMSASFDPLLGLFLSRGFAVLLPNYRGSWGYGTTFEQADDGRNRESQIDDIGALVEWIRQQPDLDSERIVIYGASWGGYFVTQSLIRYPDTFLGGLSFVGVSNLRSIAENRFFCGWQREVGDLSEPGMAEFLDGISPCNHAAEIRKPLFLFVGGKDPRVPAAPGRQMAAAMDEAGQDVWYVEIPYAGHGIESAAPIDFLYAAAALVEFFDELTQ